MTQHSIYFIIFPGFQLLDVSGPLQVFSAANEIMSVQGKNAFYQTALIASDPGVVTSSDGVEINVRRFPRVPGGKMNTVFLPGGPGLWRPGKKSSESELLDIVGWVRKSEAHIGRLASVCTGAFLLARTGLLDGRRVATHWAACDDLQRQYPEIEVERNAIYFKDAHYWSSAGVTAGIDMALSMVEADVGAKIAMDVAKQLVVFYRRPGGQSQFSSALLEQSINDKAISRLHAWISANLRRRFSVQDMADYLAMTSRTFSRFYQERTGLTPAQAVVRMRLERACNLVESKKISLKEVSRQCGFSSEEIMRRTFLRYLHVGPADYRQRFSSS